MDLDELIAFLSSPEPRSSNHELTKVLIQARIAEREREIGNDALRWAKLSAVSAAAATIIALIALLIAVL
jgi:hypothetical protein